VSGPLSLREMNDGVTYIQFCDREVFEGDYEDATCKQNCDNCPNRGKLEEAMKLRLEQLDKESIAIQYEDEARIAERQANDIIQKIIYPKAKTYSEMIMEGRRSR
jgi:hypothetical protein